MTVGESTFCSVLQSFPVFLILVQNTQRCLKTPLIYKPPTPTHSPEYYEALDGLLHSLTDHSSHGYHGGSTHGVYGGNNGVYGNSHGVYGGGFSATDHGYSYPDTSSSNCLYTYGKKLGGKCYQYVYTTGNGYHSYGSGLQGYSSLGLKKGNIYALNNVTTSVYAPGEVYNAKNRYEVKVKKIKIGKKRSRRSVGFFPQRQNQNGNFLEQAFQQGSNMVRDGITGFFRPNRHRHPVTKAPVDTIYVIETDEPMNQNRPNSNTPVIFVDEQNSGTMVFPGNRPNQGNQGFRPYEGNNGFQPNQGNNGFQMNQGNEGYQPNQGNGAFQPNEGAVNFGNGQENQNGGETGQNDPVNLDDVPEATTLPALTPVPVVISESRSNFNFGSTPLFGETCDTVDGGLGNCISLYKCPQYLKLVQESRLQATLILRKAHCGFDGNDPKVCCPLPGIPTAPPVPTTSTTTTTTTTTTTAAPSPSPKSPIPGDFVDSLPDPPVCGYSNASFSRVVGGVPAKLGDFPWMALLGYKSRRGGTSWLCGGSLISSRHVLTAAHCIHNHENDLYVVRLGELDLAREDEGATPHDVLIKQKIKHAQYSATAFTNDIGILVLESDVAYTDLIRPICIPKDSGLRSTTFEDYNPLIAGWGHTEFRGPSATHLQVLQLPVVSNSFCAQAYAPYKAQTIDDRVLCAGFKKGGKDACQGDSGGPLMQPIWSSSELQTYFYQIGVVSYGKKCAEAGFPGVYSRVTHFAPWIEEQVLGHSSR